MYLPDFSRVKKAKGNRNQNDDDDDDDEKKHVSSQIQLHHSHRTEKKHRSESQRNLLINTLYQFRQINKYTRYARTYN